MILFDLDDYAEDERSRFDMERLLELRDEIPSLAVTLFTIPDMCSAGFIADWQRGDNGTWVNLVQHGWHHRTNYECLSWTKADCKAALRRGRDMGFTTRGFKAPGWQISDGCYEALAEEGYWVADQPYNEKRRPLKLSAYQIQDSGVVCTFKSPLITSHARTITPIHGHVGHLGGHNANALELIMDDIRAAAALNADFRFIREVMES